MNQNEVLAMLHDIVANNQEWTTWTVSTPHLVMLVNKAVEAEREACAKLADERLMDTSALMSMPPKSSAAWSIAAAIRARGQA